MRRLGNHFPTSLVADSRIPAPTPSPQTEWRALGVQQSRGWVHYAIHRPEPHIMLFRCGPRVVLVEDELE